MVDKKLYCGLKSIIGNFSKFIIIYESYIKNMRKCGEFDRMFPKAYQMFKFKLQNSMKYSKRDELTEIKPYAKYTLFFTNSKVLVLDFCRHLRNSFVHAIMECKDGKIYINDIGRFQKKTSVGYLNKALVVNFVTEVVKEYEQDNKE